MITSPICFSCRWLNDKPNENDDLTCRAFPRGIPQEILDGYDHTRPYPGDSGVVFESLETVSANQKSLDGVSNRPDGSGGPLDLLEGSERVRKYNPNHDRLGRFSTGSGGGITSDDLDFAAGIKMLADLKVKNGEFDGVGDFYLAEINAQKGFNGKPQVLEGAEFEKAVQESPVGIMRRGIRNTGNFSTIDVMEDELSGAAVYTGLGIHGNGLYFGVARKLGDADDKRSKTVAQVFSDGAGTRGGATYRATLAKDARVVTVEDVTKAYFSEFGKDDALSRGSARFNSMWVMQDPGRLAAIKGFDAMLIKKADATGVISTSQVVVFNRTKLIWDGESVRSNSLEGGLKSWSLKFNPNHDRLGRFATGSAGGAFTEEDKAAVSTYLKPQKAAWSEEVNHRAINDQLRGMAEHDRPDVSDAITKLDAAFAHGDTIPAGTELYRGIPGLRLSEVYKVGDTFTDYGFSSHSKNEGEAFDFITGRAQMGTANSRATGTLLKVKVTQPTKAIDVAQHFDDPLYKREQEVLLNRGTKFRVTEIYTGPMADIEDVIVEVVR